MRVICVALPFLIAGCKHSNDVSEKEEATASTTKVKADESNESDPPVDEGGANNKGQIVAIRKENGIDVVLEEPILSPNKLDIDSDMGSLSDDRRKLAKVANMAASTQQDVIGVKTLNQHDNVGNENNAEPTKKGAHGNQPHMSPHESDTVFRTSMKSKKGTNAGKIDQKQSSRSHDSSPPSILQDANFDPALFKYVVVLPDIHGDLDAFLRSLYMAYEVTEPPSKIIQSFLEFSVQIMSRIDQSENCYLKGCPRGGKQLSSVPHDVLLVQLGDVVDRGPYTRKCLVLIAIITDIFGWKTARLYGNHEVMNHLGQAEGYVNLEELKVRTADHYPGMEEGGQLWEHIKGSSLLMARLGRADDFRKPDDSPVDPNSVLFLHAGINLEFLRAFERYQKDHSELPGNSRLNIVDRWNRVTQWMLSDGNAELADQWLSGYGAMADKSPLWSRILAHPYHVNYLCSAMLSAILKAFKVARIIVGHTPQYDTRQVWSRCNSELILADTAMSQWVGPGPNRHSNPTMLLIEKGTINAYYFKDGKKVRDQVHPILKDTTNNDRQ